ncbi:uncharacterized protein TNCV_1058491 [Trichonephila clavipes]|nr:uncharacterized protein TNCV_1058491 [Trichonephila clavipes]
MSRSGGQSEARPPVFKSPNKLFFGTHLSTHCNAATSAAKNKTWRVLIKPNYASDSPRAAAVAEFRLLAGHDCLCAHLYRFNLTDSPFVCFMDASHLDACAVLKSLDWIVKKLWRARCLMT